MPYPIPKVVYDPGSGPVTLNFTYPDTQKPMTDLLEAVRHDSFSSSGVRQSMLERVDVVKTFQLESIPWADVPALATFVNFAIQGGNFKFFPDATLSAFQTWELVDDKFTPQFNFFGISKCTLKLRKVPGGAFSL
jgi:hypothetical protein